MIRFAAALIVCFYAAAAAAAAADPPPSVDQLLAQSETQAADKQFDAALRTLQQATALEPDNLEIKLAVARIHGWQGNYRQAEQELGVLSAADPANADIQSAAAYLDYYRGRNAAAEAEFTHILQTWPHYADAADGLKLVQAAERDAAQDAAPRAVAAAYLWQFDAGYERSNFARQPQTPWNDEYAQVTRFFDGGETAVHGRIEYDDQFETTDAYYEIGVDHTFRPWLSAYLYGGHTMDASFRPAWRTETGGNLRVNPESKFESAIWTTLDIKEDQYGATSIATVDPGLRFEDDDWALSPNLVMVEQWGLPPVFGWNLRVDGPLPYEGLRFYAGYADAPETEAIPGAATILTVYTATFYGGLSYAFDPAHALSLGYTHDDRQNSYIRHAVDINFTYRL